MLTIAVASAVAASMMSAYRCCSDADDALSSTTPWTGSDVGPGSSGRTRTAATTNSAAATITTTYSTTFIGTRLMGSTPPDRPAATSTRPRRGSTDHPGH